jgi:hypothetical protein
MARYQYAQQHAQSCTAVALMVTLKEIGLWSGRDLNRGLEAMVHGLLKRDKTVGSGMEEILPHAAAAYLIEQGAIAEVLEQKSRTALLKAAAAADYKQYDDGITSSGITRRDTAVDLSTAFNNDARVFPHRRVHGWSRFEMPHHSDAQGRP